MDDPSRIYELSGSADSAFWSKLYEYTSMNNDTSIDPKQRQHFFRRRRQLRKFQCWWKQMQVYFSKASSCLGTARPDTEPGHRVQGRGQDKDKTRTQSHATEPSHRVQGRGQ